MLLSDFLTNDSFFLLRMKFLVCLVGIDNGEETIRVMEYAKRLLKILTTSSIEIVKYASKAIAYLILVRVIILYFLMCIRLCV